MNDQQQSRADTLTDAAALAMYEKASIAASEFDSVEAAHVAFVSSILAASPVERRAAAPIARVQVCGDEITLSATSDQRAVLMTMHDAPIYAEPPAATSANETGAEGAKPVAWFIDWPDEPELGHYFAEEPCDPKYGRSRALGFIESRSPAMAAAAPADELTDAEIWRMWNSIGQNVSATRPILFARALLSRRAAAPASSHETRAEGCNDLNERAHLAAGQWANANTPISEALAYRDGYIAGAHCGAMAAAAPAADKRDAVPKWIFDQMVDTLTPAWDYVQTHQEQFNARAGDDKTKIVVDEFLKHARAAASPAAVIPAGWKPMPPVLTLTDAARDVLAERRRQVEQEGWTPAHDDEHDMGEMAHAAAWYSVDQMMRSALDERGLSFWPWAQEWWKPTTPRRDLVKAGALILAELERLDRAALLNGADQ